MTEIIVPVKQISTNCNYPNISWEVFDNDNIKIAAGIGECKIDVKPSTYSIVWSATDICGNTAYCTEVLNVLGAATEQPTLNCDLTPISSDIGCNDTKIILVNAPSAYDDCGEINPQWILKDSGYNVIDVGNGDMIYELEKGNYYIEWKATNIISSVSCQVDLSLSSSTTTPFIVDCGETYTFNAECGQQANAFVNAKSISTSCDANMRWWIYDENDNLVFNGINDISVPLDSGHYSIEWESYNNSGSDTCNETIVVVENLPNMICYDNEVINIGCETSDYIYSKDFPELIGNACSELEKLFYIYQQGQVLYSGVGGIQNVSLPEGAYQVIFTLNDVVYCNYILKISTDDLTPPTMKCIATSANLDQDGSIVIVPQYFDFGSFDDCSDIILTFDNGLDHLEFDCDDIPNGIQTIIDITVTATDASGNTSSCNTELTLMDNQNNVCEDDLNANDIVAVEGFVLDTEGTPVSNIGLYDNISSFSTSLNQVGYYHFLFAQNATVNFSLDNDFLEKLADINVIDVLDFDVNAPYSSFIDINNDEQINSDDREALIHQLLSLEEKPFDWSLFDENIQLDILQPMALTQSVHSTAELILKGDYNKSSTISNINQYDELPSVNMYYEIKYDNGNTIINFSIEDTKAIQLDFTFANKLLDVYSNTFRYYNSNEHNLKLIEFCSNCSYTVLDFSVVLEGIIDEKDFNDIVEMNGVDSSFSMSNSSISNISLVEKITSSVNENNNRNMIAVYPNPFSSTFTIDGLDEYKHNVVKVYNVLNQVVYQTTVANKSKIVVNMEQNANGIYTISINDVFLDRIISQH